MPAGFCRVENANHTQAAKSDLIIVFSRSTIGGGQATHACCNRGSVARPGVPKQQRLNVSGNHTARCSCRMNANHTQAAKSDLIFVFSRSEIGGALVHTCMLQPRECGQTGCLLTSAPGDFPSQTPAGVPNAIVRKPCSFS